MKEKQLKDGALYEERFRFKERRSNALFILTIALILLIAFVFRAYWQTAIGGVQVSGTSMERTLQHGDKLLVKKTGWWHKADYGDVIVVRVDGYEEWQGRKDDKGKQISFIIKRLIAKAGDSVYCENGTVYLKKSGEVDYAPIAEPYAYYSQSKNNYDFDEYVLEKGEIFFLGDNRFVSEDSRYQEGRSQLQYLYKEKDIMGTVPEWAIENRTILEGIFFQ
ncbi:MAG: signal peptidase I [Clostridia bacterium]|nr:signal peptidase I [Clostridia bacterium]